MDETNPTLWIKGFRDLWLLPKGHNIIFEKRWLSSTSQVDATANTGEAMCM